MVYILFPILVVPVLVRNTPTIVSLEYISSFPGINKLFY